LNTYELPVNGFPAFTSCSSDSRSRFLLCFLQISHGVWRAVASRSQQAYRGFFLLWPTGEHSVNTELDRLVRRMVDGHILYSEAVREFKRAFIGTALRDSMGNQNRTAQTLRMHRNTLSRNLAELGIKPERRVPQRAAA
jgi:DNA-binding NtrC family response regulator